MCPETMKVDMGLNLAPAGSGRPASAPPSSGTRRGSPRTWLHCPEPILRFVATWPTDQPRSSRRRTAPYSRSGSRALDRRVDAIPALQPEGSSNRAADEGCTAGPGGSGRLDRIQRRGRLATGATLPGPATSDEPPSQRGGHRGGEAALPFRARPHAHVRTARSRRRATG
jgi:hypothetical protein